MGDEKFQSTTVQENRLVVKIVETIASGLALVCILMTPAVWASRWVVDQAAYGSREPSINPVINCCLFAMALVVVIAAYEGVRTYTGAGLSKQDLSLLMACMTGVIVDLVATLALLLYYRYHVGQIESITDNLISVYLCGMLGTVVMVVVVAASRHKAG